jgi:hypothetical protein
MSKTTYNIHVNSSWADFGDYDGDTPEEAFEAMLEDVGRGDVPPILEDVTITEVTAAHRFHRALTATEEAQREWTRGRGEFPARSDFLKRVDDQILREAETALAEVLR